MDELSEEDKFTVARARKIQRFLSQPFQVAEIFTGHAGKLVSLEVSYIFQLFSIVFFLKKLLNITKVKHCYVIFLKNYLEFVIKCNQIMFFSHDKTRTHCVNISIFRILLVVSKRFWMEN